MSHKEEKHHISHIRIAKDFGCSLDSFDVNALEKVHMVKAKIYKEFGDVGIQLYREGIKDFFNNRSHAFQSLMENGDFGNTIKNYYVIPRIEQRLKSIFEQVKNDYFSKVNTFPYNL